VAFLEDYKHSWHTEYEYPLPMKYYQVEVLGSLTTGYINMIVEFVRSGGDLIR